MTPAIHLNQTETKKIENKDSVAYKALLVALRELRSRYNVRVSVIGTNSHGDLFEIDIEE